MDHSTDNMKHIHSDDEISISVKRENGSNFVVLSNKKKRKIYTISEKMFTALLHKTPAIFYHFSRFLILERVREARLSKISTGKIQGARKRKTKQPTKRISKM